MYNLSAYVSDETSIGSVCMCLRRFVLVLFMGGINIKLVEERSGYVGCLSLISECLAIASSDC